MTSATSDAATTTGARQNKHRRTTTTTSRGVSVLMYASQQGDVERVRKIIADQPITLHSRDRTGKTPLHYCSTSDNICSAQAADLLVMAAPDLVDSRDEDGFTPLHLAVIAGNMPLVTFLLANKADVNAVDNEKHTVVHWAAVCGETAALRAVLAAGAPVSTPDVHGGYPLHYAAQMCGGEKDSSLGLQVLQTLLTHSDIVVTVEDGDGRQPLLWAASAGSAKAVLALIRAGAAVESSDKDGLTALHCAASRGHTDCIDSLLTLCGASPDVIDSNGCTALHYAVTLGHADATALLLTHGTDPNRQDRKGRTPAHCGCAKGQFETVKLIGAHGANLWLRNARGDLPLHEAAASGRRDLVRWLLDMRPSQVNARNNDGRCPLHLAALNDNADMCKILLDAGAQINPILRTSKNTFMTPLDCALQRGFRSTAKYLQLHGGVPATRPGDLRHTQVSAGVNLQIKDDVTFWGDTSSDSERENGEISKNNKRVQRKKLTHKYEKKKASLSGSDVEHRKFVNAKPDSNKRRKFGEKNQSAKMDHRTDSATSSDLPKKSKIAPKTKLDYTNEIIINERTEINIQNTKQVTNQEVNIPNTVSTEVAEKVISEINVDKEQRPKSAKNDVKVRDQKSGKLSGKDDSAKKKNKAEKLNSNQKQGNYEQSQNEEIFGERIIKTEVEENEKKQQSDNLVPSTVTDALDNQQHNLADQQSIMSNTSEDVEEHKSLVVEAAIHEPPKKTEAEVKTEESKDETSQNIKEESKSQIAENIIPNVENVEKQVENVPTFPDKDNKIETEISEKIEKAVEITTDSEVRDTETKHEQEIINQPSIDLNVSDDKVAPESSLYNSTETSIIDTKESSNQQIENSLHVSIEQDRPPQENNVNTYKEENSDLSKENLEQLDEKSKQNKPKNKKHRKKQKNVEDQAYEIIYKTLGDNENEEIHDSSDIKEKRSKNKQKLKAQKTISQTKSSDEYSSDQESESSTSTSLTVKEHKSFRILDDKEAEQIEIKRNKSKKIQRKLKGPLKKQRSRSEENKKNENQIKKNKIPTTLSKSHLSKSDKYLHIPDRKTRSSMESRVPSLPNINERIKEPPRSDSNMSAPLLASVYSDEEVSASELEQDEEDEEEEQRSSATKRKKIKRKSRAREAKSAGSDYESSNVIDSGFEPSPRSSRIPKWKNMSERGVNMTSVTQSIQSNIRRYHLERKIFQHLLDLKRMQIRAGQHNEAILVKRAIDSYHQSCAATVGAGRYVPEDYSFKSFEKFLYLSLRKLQRNGADHLKGLPESSANPLLCTQSTHRCMHATHAYTGIPCAAYLPKMDHHTIPKIGFTSTQCKPGTGFLPTINPKKAVTLELCHGNDKQVISLPADRLDQNKRYYVTFTVKGSESTPPNEETTTSGHRHSKSD